LGHGKRRKEVREEERRGEFWFSVPPVRLWVPFLSSTFILCLFECISVLCIKRALVGTAWSRPRFLEPETRTEDCGSEMAGKLPRPHKAEDSSSCKYRLTSPHTVLYTTHLLVMEVEVPRLHSKYATKKQGLALCLKRNQMKHCRENIWTF
jgi:hypothetical protein